MSGILSAMVGGSYSSPPATYAVAANAGATSVNEAASLSFNVTTTNVSNGTTLYWTVNNVTTTNADFTAVSGSFTITSNAGSFSVTPTADLTTEGAETFTVSVRTGSVSGTVVATSSSITVNDTSRIGVSGTWDTWSFTDTMTNVVRFSMNEGCLAIHGVFNTNKLVMTFTAQDSVSPFVNKIYVAVFDLSTYQFAVDSGTTLGNSSNSQTVVWAKCAAQGISANAALSSSIYGLVSMPNFVTPNWRWRGRGYTLNNTASASTSAIPTITLSTPYEWTVTGFADPYCGGVGGASEPGRFLVNRRDNQLGDANTTWVLTTNGGASAPTLFRTATLGGAQGAGEVFGVISNTGNYAAYYTMPGNNNNFIQDHFRAGNSSSDFRTQSDGGFGSFGGSYFTGSVYKDVSGDVCIISQANASGTSKHSAGRWTNARASTPATPSISRSTVRSGLGLWNKLLPAGDIYAATTSHTIYLPTSVGSAARFDTLAATSGTSFGLAASITTGQTAGANSYIGSWDYNALNWYSATFGQWIISWQHNTGTTIGQINFQKWNP